MAAISAKDVAELRKKTGCGMMECKNALVEANGNMDEAVKVLRERGLAVAAKKADRIAAEGIVDILTEGNVSAMIEVNSETDFVAKNESFREFVRGILKTIIAQRPADVEALKAWQICRRRSHGRGQNQGNDFHNRRENGYSSFRYCGRRDQFLYSWRRFDRRYC